MVKKRTRQTRQQRCLPASHRHVLRGRAGGFPAAGAAGLVRGQDAEGGQAVEDFFDVGFVRALEGSGDFSLGPLGRASNRMDPR